MKLGRIQLDSRPMSVWRPMDRNCGFQAHFRLWFDSSRPFPAHEPRIALNHGLHPARRAATPPRLHTAPRAAATNHARGGSARCHHYPTLAVSMSSPAWGRSTQSPAWGRSISMGEACSHWCDPVGGVLHCGGHRGTALGVGTNSTLSPLEK
jgi:hypothetical protein